LIGLLKKHPVTIKNFAWRAVQNASRQGITFLILVISAKLLSSEDFGIYNYTVAISYFFTLLADFGISRAVSKYVAQYNTESPHKVKLIYFNSSLIMITLIIVFSSIFFLFAKTIVGEHYRFVYYLIPVFIFLPLTSLFDGVYSGLKQFKKLSVIALIAGTITVVATYILISKFGIIGAFLSLNFYYIIGFILFSSTFKLFSFKFDKEIIKEVGRYSSIIGISAIGYFLYSKGITYILGQFNYFTEVGYYEIIDKVFIMLSFPFIIYGQIIAPGITEMITLSRYENVLNRFKKNLSVAFPIAVIITLILWQILPLLIKVFLVKYYTPDFIVMFELLLIHLPLLLISGFVVQPFIIATGKAKYSLLTIPFGLINIGLGILFIGYYGFIGMIYSTLIISITNKILTYYLIYNGLRKMI
jgi:O-antigen/teichoic acid export membrane protein